jgi:hypothetical protein
MRKLACDHRRTMMAPLIDEREELLQGSDGLLTGRVSAPAGEDAFMHV